MSMTIEVPSLDALASGANHEAIQEEYARRVEFMMRRYVPVEENILRPSSLASDFAAGLLTWSTPYAAKQFYVPMNHTEPGTCDHWDEALKREHMPELEGYVAKLYEEG